MNNKYPPKLFLIGLLLNVFKHYYLFLPAIVLLIIGIRIKICLIIGIALLAIDITVSLIHQIKVVKTILKSDNPNFKEAQSAVLSPEWQTNIHDFVEAKGNENGSNDI